MAHKWSPISDYEVEPRELADPELGALSAVWKEQKSGLEGLERFTERLKREWAIETGLIERLYDLDRGVTELLIERGIDAALIPHRAGLGDKKVAMIGDQKSAIESIFAFVKGDRLFVQQLRQGTPRVVHTQPGLRRRPRPVLGGERRYPSEKATTRVDRTTRPVTTAASTSTARRNTSGRKWTA